MAEEVSVVRLGRDGGTVLHVRSDLHLGLDYELGSRATMHHLTVGKL